MRTIIGVLTYQRLDMLQTCLESLRAVDRSACEIVIANNSEDDGYIVAVEDLARQHRVGLLTFRKNRGTSASWNALARVYDSDEIVIFNDDIRVMDGWLEAIRETISDPCVGLISLSLANGPEPWTSYRNAAPLVARPPLQRFRCVYPTGALLAMRREVFDRVGGFDENLWIGFEEVDFGIRACRLGLENFNVGTEGGTYLFAAHYGGATGYSPKSDQAAYFERKHGVAFPMSQEWERQLLAGAGP